ncbi:MAG TPA: type 1 glutamine amidotransferase domain-containing protein [Streptosporangiaceae bacterium]|nr:type 1 glutamine amidotransferase domain-containing protein [Streptosporangiaceae bacterium]
MAGPDVGGTTAQSGGQSGGRPLRATVLVEQGYHELGLWYPVLRLRELGADVSIAGPEPGQTYMSALGYPVIPDQDLAAAAGREPGLLIVPDGEAGQRLAASKQASALIESTRAGGRGVVVTGDPDDLPDLISRAAAVPAEPHLHGRRVLVLAESQYQELELWYPVLRFRGAGADVAVASPARGGLYASKIGYPVRSDCSVEDIAPDDVDALIIPGGFAPEAMRRCPPLLDLVRKTCDNGTIVAAICHAGWVLASAGLARGRRLTCVPVIRDDVVSAGADYADAPVVRDGNLITSRLPNDLPDFCGQIAAALREPAAARGDGRSWPAAGGRASTAAYSVPAELRMAPAGPANANYRAVSVPAL